MKMTKEEFVAYIQKMARRERERKELEAKEHERRISFIVTDYIMTTARRMKWDRNYRRTRNPKGRKWDSMN